MIDYDMFSSLFWQVDTTQIADAHPAARAMTSALTLRSASARICAPAFTVRARSDAFAVARAIETAPAGSVLVVDGQGERLALVGELFARGALARHLAGIVVDAAVRDQRFLRTCQLPVYSRHVTPRGGPARDLGELSTAVTCGGVSVDPDDVVLADDEGILVLSPTDAMQALSDAHLIRQTETRAIHRMEGGGTLSDCLNVADHEATLLAGTPSRLEFLT